MVPVGRCRGRGPTAHFFYVIDPVGGLDLPVAISRSHKDGTAVGGAVSGWLGQMVIPPVANRKSLRRP